MFVRAGALASNDTQQPKLPPGIIPDGMPSLIPGDELGYLPGSAGVADDGAFTYAIPLDVPAGRAGMQPALSLSYSSNAGNGVLGAGWTVSGGSEIVRCPKSLNGSGITDGVDFDDDDALCLEGQKLETIQGAYGAAGTEYRTRNDEFARIVGEGTSPLGTATFKVWTRSGRTLTFTPNDTPRVVASSAGVAIVQSPSVEELSARTSWTLSRQEDRAGNAMTYEYELVHGGPENAATEILLSKIAYTSHANGEPAHREVRFVYENRPDVSFGWSSGVGTQRTKRLRAIEMYAPNPSSTAKVWEYAFEYEPQASIGSSRSLLHSVKKCAFNGGCLWAKEFDWTQTLAQPLFEEQSIGQLLLSTAPDPGTDAVPGPFPPLAAKAGMKIFDFDGDGADDILYRVTEMESRHYFRRSFVGSDGTVMPLAVAGNLNDSDPVLGGYNGVEWLSIRPFSGDGAAAKLWVEGAAGHATLEWNPIANAFSGSWSPGSSVYGSGLFADLDGDRRIQPFERAYIEDVADHSFPDNEDPDFRLLVAGQDAHVEPGCPLKFADLDGDGRTDVLTRDNPAPGHCQGDIIMIARDDDGSIVARPFDFTESYASAQFADFNGDGLGDALLLPDFENPAIEPELWWNTGNGFYPSNVQINIPHDDYARDSWGNAGDVGIRLADVNRDGRMDIVSFHESPNAGITFLFSNGDGSFRTFETDFSPGTPIPNNDGTVDAAPGAGMRGWTMSQLGDFDGDGRTDVVRVVDGELRILTQTPTFTDRINAVFDESTAWPREMVFYSNSFDERPGLSECSYPLTCIRKGLTVVRRLESRAHWTEAVLGSEPYVLEYSYSDPVADVRGGGFLGFGERRIWNPQQPSETVVTYDHRVRVIDPSDASGTRAIYPYAGRPKTETVSVPILSAEEAGAKPSSAELRISTTTYAYQLKWLNGGATFVVVPEGSETKTFEHSGFVEWGVPTPVSSPGFVHVWPSGPLGSPLRTQTSSATYDDFANRLSESSATLGGALHQTRSTFVNDTANWLIGLPSTRQVTMAEADGTPAPVTRHYEFKTNAFGQVETAWIEKNDPALSQMHVSTYDPVYGILIGETSSGVGVLPRQIRYAYDALYPGAPDEKVYRSQIWAPRLGGQYVPTGWFVVEPAYGVPVMMIDANLNTAVRHYDDLGRLHLIEPAVGQPTSLSYTPHRADDGSANGFVVGVAHGGQAGTTQHDALGRTLSTTATGFGGEEIRQDFRYDLRGSKVAQSRPYVSSYANALIESRWSFDSLGRLLQSTAPDGAVVRHAYSFLQTRTWDAANQESVVTRDIDGRVVSSINMNDGKELETTFAFAPFDLLERVTDPAGNVVRMEYDALGRRTRQVDPDSGVTEVIYSGLGDVLSEKRVATNEITGFAYDDLGRVVLRTDSDGTTSFEWDTAAYGIGALASTRSPDGIVRKNRYDAFGRTVANDLIDESTGETFGLAITYDARGRLDTLAYPELPDRDRFVVQYEYNDAGFMRRVVEIDAEGSGIPLWTVEQRNADLALTQGRLGNGLDIQRTYSPITGRLERMLAVGAQGSASVFDMNYEYDSTGLVERRNDLVAGRDEAFSHDAIGRLRYWTLDTAGASTSTEYRYDDIGNLLDVMRNGALAEHNVYGNAAGGQPHTLTVHDDVASGAQATYKYDGLGRLWQDPARQTDYTAFDLPRFVAKGGSLWTFAYDAERSRTKKSGPDGTSLYMDGFYERRDSGGNRKHVFRVNGPDGEIAQVVHEEHVGDVVEYPIRDALGSTGVVTDKLGTPVQRMFYEPFGARIAADGAAFAGSVGDVKRGFTGHEHDDALGLINMRGRMYDPALRRFVTPDPVVAAPMFGQSWNPYSYVVNSPLNLTDPTGFTWCSSYACVYKAGSFGETLANWSVGRGYGAHAGYDQTYGAPQEYGSGLYEPLGSGEGAVSNYTTAVASSGMPTVERQPDGTPSVCRDAGGSLGAMDYDCTVVGEESGHEPFTMDWQLRAGDAWDDANDRFDRNFPVTGPLFEHEYPGTPAWRERSSDQEIQKQGASLLIALAPLTAETPGAIRAAREGVRPTGSYRRRYGIADGTNPSGCGVNCGKTSLAGLKRIHGIDAGAAATEGTDGLNWFANLRDAVADVFGPERVTETTAGSIRDVVSMMRERPPGSSAILMNEVRIGGRILPVQGHYTVATVEQTGIVRFIDFQTESAAAYKPDSVLWKLSDGTGEAVTETFRVIFVDP